MSPYCKIKRTILRDNKFNHVSTEAKLVFFVLLVHPNLTLLGAMHCSIAGLASELGWPIEKLQEALLELCAQDMVLVDLKAHLIWLPNFLHHNPPFFANGVKSWGTALAYLPDCPLKEEVIGHVKRFASRLAPGLQAALPAVFLFSYTPTYR
jgi:hypothetical protein